MILKLQDYQTALLNRPVRRKTNRRELEERDLSSIFPDTKYLKVCFNSTNI